jgi:hypothetical protein
MEAVNIQFAPATGTEEAWNEAYARLADYFRSYQLHNRIRRTQLILETLRKAAEAHAKDPTRTPTAHSIEQARLMLREWLGSIYSDLNLSEAQLEATGRLGFHLAGGPSRWPQFFLDEQNMPDDMAEAMRSALRTSGPGMQVSKMTPRDIDLGMFTDVADDTFDRLGRHPILRYSVLFVIVVRRAGLSLFPLRMSAPIGSQTANIAMTAGMPPKHISRTRRATFFSLVGLGTIVGAWLSFIFLSENGMRISEWALLLVFIPLYYQLNVGFWTAMFGVWLMNRPKPDPLNLWLTLSADDYEQPITASTAIVMPVFNEDVTRVFEGLRSIYLSLGSHRPVEELRLFHPQRFRQNQPVDRGRNRWLELCRQLKAFGRIFYRQAPQADQPQERQRQRLLPPLGKALPLHGRARCGQPHVRRPAHRMVRIMEKNPGIGISRPFRSRSPPRRCSAA